MSESIKKIYASYTSELNENSNLKGIKGSMYSFFISSFVERYRQRTCLFVLKDNEEASYIMNDLQRLLPNENILFFPSSYKKHSLSEIDNINLLQRIETINLLKKGQDVLIVTYPEAIYERVTTKDEMDKNILSIKIGDSYSMDFIMEVFYEYGFSFVDFVQEPGQFSVRGGIVDVFSYSNEKPYRIDFFGDEIDSIRAFDIETQKSVENHNEIEIVPNIQSENVKENKISLFDFMQKKVSIFFSDLELMKEKLKNLKNGFKKLDIDNKNQIFINEKELEDGLKNHHFIEINTSHIGGYKSTLEIKSSPHPVFNKNFDLLRDSLKENKKKGLKNVIFFSDEKQKDRFKNIFHDIDKKVEYFSVVSSIYQGFIDLDNKIACYTDHQIFERYYRYKTKINSFKSQALTIKELTNLNKGDYVTHIDHGIGIFSGLHKIEVGGKYRETIKIEYAAGDIVYVNIHALHKISKFNSKDGKEPTIHKLGSNVWNNLKQKTKRKVKEIAYDLVKLYAQRKSKNGYAFSPDNYLQHELEASFIYEDTEDQVKASMAVKSDMEKETPMDRLVCGDVGFGKTEIAIRASFKAVNDNKQVVVLVPTTILAFQHYQTFKERLKDFPVNIDYINRFRTTKEKNDILKKLEDGKIDIIIGTHQLVNNKIKYKDLGLLIIDEEQKFGVAIKDKIKTLKVNIDTLTLTATPIPRTMQFSLMAARDLSIINTPPPNRYPIETQVIRFNTEIIKDAILHELNRGGQVYFIHNKVQNINEVANIISKLVPGIRIAVGHGQMDGKILEDIMVDFMDGKYDLLVATTIIENGLDIPNSNTIIINEANKFGLSDLHQMRGRVGRSNKKAYCYFISPPYKEMTQEARTRLQALEMFSDLGQGFNIAMKDLEIRGAGDLLGAEQSGFISDIGIDTYEKILAEAMLELKNSKEFEELFEDEKNDTLLKLNKDIYLDTDFEAFFPDEYVGSTSEKISLYRELSKIDNQRDLDEFRKNIRDRFGILPEETNNLLKIINIKWLAKRFDINRLILKNNKILAYIEQNSYNNPNFSKIIEYISKNPNFCELKQNEENTIFTIKHVKSLDKVLEIFNILVA